MRKYIWAVAIMAAPSTNGQVIFSKPTTAQSQSSGPATSNLSVTYMGTPINATDSVKGSVPKPTLDSLNQLSDSTKRIMNARMVELNDSLCRLDRTILELETNEKRRRSQTHLGDIPSILPIRIISWKDYRVSSGFGMRWHPITGQMHNHAGIDFPQPLGEWVYATANGYVDKVIMQPEGLGLAIYLNHASGYTTVYGHLSAYQVIPGQYVTRGEIIGRVGSTGRSTGPHLHYSVLTKGRDGGFSALDPSPFCFLLLDYNSTSVKQKKPIKTPEKDLNRLSAKTKDYQAAP